MREVRGSTCFKYTTWILAIQSNGVGPSCRSEWISFSTLFLVVRLNKKGIHSCLGSFYHPYIVLWSKISIHASTVAYELRSKISNKQVFPRLYHPANPLPLNPLFHGHISLRIRNGEIFLLFHKSNGSFTPGAAISFSTIFFSFDPRAFP